MEDLHAKFLPQFLAMSEVRLARATEAAQSGNYAVTASSVRELHGLAGEAGLLGLAAIVPLARRAEELAKRLLAVRTDEAAVALVAALAEIRAALPKLPTP